MLTNSFLIILFTKLAPLYGSIEVKMQRTFGLVELREYKNSRGIASTDRIFKCIA